MCMCVHVCMCVCVCMRVYACVIGVCVWRVCVCVSPVRYGIMFSLVPLMSESLFSHPLVLRDSSARSAISPQSIYPKHMRSTVLWLRG